MPKGTGSLPCPSRSAQLRSGPIRAGPGPGQGRARAGTTQGARTTTADYRMFQVSETKSRAKGR
jgi:hypothetical protein